MSQSNKYACYLLVALVLVRLYGGGATPFTPVETTAAVYVYEKSNTAVPSAVQVGLNTLNRQGIVATLFDVNTLDGGGETPEQYKLAVPAAKEVGLPALVVMGGDKVLRSVAAPTTKEQVLEAAGIQ